MARKRRDSRTVRLESGGTITISFRFSNFDLNDRDREFVAYLIDMARDYEASRPSDDGGRKRRARRAEPAEADPAIANEL